MNWLFLREIEMLSLHYYNKGNGTPNIFQVFDINSDKLGSSPCPLFFVILIICEINLAQSNLGEMPKTMLVLHALLGWSCLSIDT